VSIREYCNQLNTELVALRRELHQIPEVGLHLPLTQARILKALEGLPLEITLGRSLSSVVAVLRGTAPGGGGRPVVLLRGDMDALPVKELSGEPFASTNGNMHACGHDLHMSLLVGAVKALVAHRDELAGDVIFQFQPGEESVNGCLHMLNEGLLDVAGRRPEAAWAIHVWAGLDPLGTFSTKPGPVMASTDEIKVRVIGRGGHGSAPHLAADPVPAMAEMITATHAMVTRRFSVFDPVVVSVGRVQAGTAANVIPEEAFFDATMRTFCQTYMPNLEEKLRLHEGSRSLFDLYQVDEEVERALARRVPLKSGGYLIFDQTEALTTIDVNTGGYISGRNFDDTVFRTNLEATQTLARQLQLRNLGGIIIVDFIDMHSAEHRETVLQSLRSALQQDRTKTTVNGFSSLGLVEMTRKRTRDSLERMLCEPCTACHGKGTIKTARTVCYEIMREIAREARQFDPKEFRILASQQVIDLLLDEESPHLAILGENVGKPITLHVEPAYAQEDYDIILA